MQLLSTLGLQGALRELIPAFEQTGAKVNAIFGPTAVMMERIGGGEIADLAILTQAGIDKLISTGTMLLGSRTDLVRSAVGIAVRAGAPKPDISTVEAFRRTLLSAKSIAYSRAGASGIFFAGLIERLGIAAEVNAKAIIPPSGFTAVYAADGRAGIAVQQISELMEVAGIDIVGPLPSEIGSLTVFSAGIFSASAAQQTAQDFVAFLSTPSAAAVLQNTGLTPLIGAGPRTKGENP
jgi:molybdate transport system substrate-binding protein